MKYPRPLEKGSRIGITAFSSGVSSDCHERLNIVISGLEERGYVVVEGNNLRSNVKHVSASAEARAEELMTFLCDESLDAIFPPWGGELAMEVLPLLDFQKLSQVRPKWIVGYSDISTILLAITTKIDWATVHSANLMDLHLKQSDSLTNRVFDLLRLNEGASLIQHSSSKFELSGESFAENPNATFNLTGKTLWKVLNEDSESCVFSGRLIGGCFDILQCLVATEYFDIQSMFDRYENDGVILYFENAEMAPTAYLRALLSLKFRDVFKVITGVLIGRNAVAGGNEQDLSSYEALSQVLSDINIPVIYDADIGHVPPNMALINGSIAEVAIENGAASVSQTLR